MKCLICPCESCESDFQAASQSCCMGDDFTKDDKLGFQGDSSIENLSKFTKEMLTNHVVDRLANLEELVTLCREALTCSDHKDIKQLVGNVLYFYVQEEIDIAKMELRAI